MSTPEHNTVDKRDEVRRLVESSLATDRDVASIADLAITPGGRVGDASPLGKKGGKRRLDDYVREVAHALMREHGFTKSHAIATAKNSIRRWSRSGKHTKAAVRTGALASRANQARLDAGLTEDDIAEIVDLAFWNYVLHPRGHGGRFIQSRSYTRPPMHSRPPFAAKDTPKIKKKTPGVPRMARHKPGDVIEPREQAKKIAELHRQQEVVRHANLRAAEHDREFARRIVASQGLGTGRSKTPRRRRKPEFTEMHGSATRGLLHGAGFSSFSEDEQTVIDLALTEALDRDLIDLSSHVPGQPYRFRHGWIPLNGGTKKGHGLDLGFGGGKGHSEGALHERYKEHVNRVDRDLAENATKLDTSRNGIAGTTDEHGNIAWSKERSRVHRQIVKERFAELSQGVPRDRHVLFLGGPPGAGKSSALRGGHVPGYSPSTSITINPDDFKVELAKRGLVPHLPGMTPLERSAFVHEESSRMASMLAAMARESGHNVTMDTTMSGGKSTKKKLDQFHRAGYSSQAAFVDIPFEESQQRVIGRHQRGTIAHWQGSDRNPLGERLVPSSHVGSGKSKEGRTSAYRDAFESIKNNFDEYRLFDNNNPNPKDPPKLIGEKELKNGKRKSRPLAIDPALDRRWWQQ